MMRLLCNTLLSCLALTLCVNAQNQTETLSPVLSEDLLPFTLKVDVANFSLPTGLQSYASAIYDGKWIILAGRTNGLHGFNNFGNNFPPEFQNANVYVIDPNTGTGFSRSLKESGLSQFTIDTLTVTASEFFQKQDVLYVVGGYGINTLTGQMETKSTITAINLEWLVEWVSRGRETLVGQVRQVSDPLLQVTGGFLYQNTNHDPFLLIVGQNFQGLYTPNSNGTYTQQIRRFWLNDNGKRLLVFADRSSKTNPDYRRRDLNVLPIISNNRPAYVVFGGVFTLTSGVWTVPIIVAPDGSSFEPNPAAPITFKQAMNQYNCPSFGLYSASRQEMYTIFPGGISFGFFSGGTFQTNSENPFINQITTIKIDRNYNFTQHLMKAEYPFLVSEGSNPGNQLLFGAEAQFFPANDIATHRNGIIQFDRLTKPVVLGYIVGGIMSTLPDTNSPSDSTSSPYVFRVTLIPR